MNDLKRRICQACPQKPCDENPEKCVSMQMFKKIILDESIMANGTAQEFENMLSMG